MSYFACFNELSIDPLCASAESADQRVRDFLRMWKEARALTHVSKVRHNGNMTTIKLTESMTLQDYINDHTTDPAARALLGSFIQPQVDMDDEISLQRYIDTEVRVKTGADNVGPADGFSAAYCQNTFCVGFESCVIWQNDFFDLIVTSNNKIKNVRWACISSPLTTGTEEKCAYRRTTLEEWLQEKSVELVESSLRPEQKPIHVDGDHGQRELKNHAMVLNRHPYVEGVVTSLPFSPTSRDYISRITDDGMVDVVLWWEDAGYSMRVKTTGRNVFETREIARLLKEQYGRQK